MYGECRQHYRPLAGRRTQLEAATGERNALLHADKPEARAAGGAPPNRLEIEAASVIAHRQCQAPARRKEPHPQIMGISMPQHVIDCFLGNAKTGGLGIGVELVRRFCGVEMRGDAGDASLAIEVRAQRRGQTKIVQLRRTQAERELPDALQRLLHRLDALRHARAQRRVACALQRLELYLERREYLADVVVQIARQAAAFFLLHFQQAAGEPAQPLVRELELAVHALERFLRTQPFGDVVKHYQARAAAAPAHEMRHGVDVERLAVLVLVSEDAAIYRLAGLVAQEIAPLVRAPQIAEAHTEELVARIAVDAQRRIVYGENPQRLVVEHAHRQRARFEKHPIASRMRIDAIDELLQLGGERAHAGHGGAMVPRHASCQGRGMDALLPPEAAAAAGLRYVNGAGAGIRRVRSGKAFRYLGPNGRAIRGSATLARIRALVIPPAWTEVWICPHEDGHLQAWGRDARRRKQYRYHERWRDVRDATKYARLAAFGRALARIRRQVSRDLARPRLPREKVLATVVRLLERTFVRIGNEEYARENSSFGLTTLRERQVRVRGSQLRFRFRGKSGVLHEVALNDPRIARIVRQMQELPGEELFHYVGDDGATHAIESADVNAYLKSIAGEEFTSKDFRTWAGTLLCARALRELTAPASAHAARRELRRAVESTAIMLRNTPAVCRKCYIHPAVMDSFLSGRLQQAMQGRSEETALIRLLEQRGNGHARARSLPHRARHRRRTGAAHGDLPALRGTTLARTPAQASSY